MKRTITTGFIAILITFSSFGQEINNEQSIQRFRAQVYTGGPSLLKMAVGISNTYQDKVTYSGVPLIGTEFDYRVLDWLSVGGDISFRFGQVEFDVLDSTFFNDINEQFDIDLSDVVDPFGHYQLKIPRLRGMVKANFHVLPRDSRSDLYFTAGIGFNRSKPTLTLRGEELQFFNAIGTLNLPVSYRTSVGYSFYFTENIGAFAEVGLGGPVLSGGITARF